MCNIVCACECVHQREGAETPADWVAGTYDLILEEQMAGCCWKAFGMGVCVCIYGWCDRLKGLYLGHKSLENRFSLV